MQRSVVCTLRSTRAGVFGTRKKLLEYLLIDGALGMTRYEKYYTAGIVFSDVLKKLIFSVFAIFSENCEQFIIYIKTLFTGRVSLSTFLSFNDM